MTTLPKDFWLYLLLLATLQITLGFIRVNNRDPIGCMTSISSGTLSIISLLTQKCIRLQQAIFFVNFFALLHEISNLCVAVPREPNIKSFHRLIKNVINISAASVTAGSLYLWSPWHVVEMNEDDESQPGSGGGSNVNQSMHLGSKHKQRSKKTQHRQKHSVLDVENSWAPSTSLLFSTEPSQHIHGAFVRL
ncbi:putative transmembrane protein [Toxoplasma gondii TgCatPRC2]|uniref:Transmembrane protein n=13 Tax=Toxoplasma gondii TaxID=5811 RepID=A0A125YYI7_TOXGV|nr:hypothetical protein TGME49_294808 [Toxoplasma gondii ME49]EPR57718.1 hypothetical protein TGGT1_294808 [Toxoplasma gondii GT1]ESS29203.1 putative transmembrane protein [Toxoplasma gondii VEG]KAF4646197.1 hypothetical protein TGRH88_019840 [Toxoplasma gondii]KFG35316.1 putative transmembrane protein [Toxoplasma gondii p89]KFG37331.1 putative transmembrane protein [Toxoplasma gondii GAB2-2007-GAL-DOM2]KFG46678.1 putative transmembrane protein [Toxoplasma gondii FOU]KFH14262.1 putative tran|eukprot:XP_018638570.1 hypothetical protein TGME49_294808 [Toxoplasma gondii ME49]